MNPLTAASSLRDLWEHYRTIKGASWVTSTGDTNEDWRRVLFTHFSQDQAVKDFTTQDAASFITYLLSRGNNGNTIRRRMRWLHDIFQFAVNTKAIAENPVEFRKLPRIKKAVVSRVPFLPAEFEKLINSLNYLTAMDQEMWTAACRVGYHTGLRISDVANLRWEPNEIGKGNYVDFTRECIIANPQKTWAQRKEVEIPIEPELFELLNRLYVDEPGTWVNPLFHFHQHRSRDYIVSRFRFICDRIGLRDHSFHSFRHGFVSRLVNAGVAIPIVQSMTGQSEASIRLYIHVTHQAKTIALAQARTALHQVKLNSFRTTAA